MHSRVALACFLLVCGCASAARADPFSVLPDGRVVYTTSLTTSGVFLCEGNLPCSGSGTNSVTIGSGTNQSTITFTGVTTTVQVGSRSMPVTLGSFEAISPLGFRFPERANPNNPVLRFNLQVLETDPVTGRHIKRWLMGPGGGEDLPVLLGTSHFLLPISPPPDPLGYTAMAFTIRPSPYRIPGHGSRDLIANAGLVPEPGTLVLLGSGLAAAAAARRRKKAARL